MTNPKFGLNLDPSSELPILKDGDLPDYSSPSSNLWSSEDKINLILNSSNSRNKSEIFRGFSWEKPHESIISAIGCTPMVKLTRFAAKHNIKCKLYAKCEFLSVGGSVKDRIGKAMIEDAENNGYIKPGDTLIEPTSGNTGIGIALAAAVKGYNMVVTLPEKMSQEKVNAMKALGAEILRTPTEAAWNSPESHIGLAVRLNKAINNSFILDQYKNRMNPLVHYDYTAEEILLQLNNKIDMIVIAAGTGGTVSGIGRKIKEKLPNCSIVAVDPKGSILAFPDYLNEKNKNETYLVEGIGYDFIPPVLDRNIVDLWIKSDDNISFMLAREIIRCEGLLVGGSSGSALFGVLEAACNLGEDDVCCVILPDSSRNYMSKFLSDDWMVDNGFLQYSQAPVSPLLEGKTVANLSLHTPVTILQNVNVSSAIYIMDNKGIDQVPVINDDGDIAGVVTEGNLTSYLASGRLNLQDPVKKGMYTKFKKVSLTCPLSAVSQMLESHAFIIVVSEQQCHGGIDVFVTKNIVVGVITRIDILRYLNS